METNPIDLAKTLRGAFLLDLLECSSDERVAHRNVALCCTDFSS